MDLQQVDAILGMLVTFGVLEEGDAARIRKVLHAVDDWDDLQGDAKAIYAEYVQLRDHVEEFVQRVRSLDL